jgi:hypothetical protein
MLWTQLLRRVALAGLVAAVAFPVIAEAGTLGYWRHEEGPLGQNVSTTGIPPDNVLDSSGQGNHMRTFSGATAATYVSDVSPVPLRSGLPNTLALDFDLDEDGPGPDLNDDNYTELKTIEVWVWEALTVELAFNLESTFIFQALTGKDGQPIPENPIQPFVVKVRGDGFPGGIFNQLQVEWLDGDGDEHALVSGFSMLPDTWYHVAFVLTATTAELYIATGSSDYVLVDSTSGEDYAGPGGDVIYTSVGAFTVGRGQFGGGNADWVDAIIDEVRYSDEALSPSGFLFDFSSLADDDMDGVPNGDDVCPNTPLGAAVDAEGRPIGDLDLDCDTDLFDYALFITGFTGPLQ